MPPIVNTNYLTEFNLLRHNSHGQSPLHSDDSLTTDSSASDVPSSFVDTQLPQTVGVTDADDHERKQSTQTQGQVVEEGNNDLQRLRQGNDVQQASEEQENSLTSVTSVSAAADTATTDEIEGVDYILVKERRIKIPFYTGWPPNYVPVLCDMMSKDKIKGATRHTENLSPLQTEMLAFKMTDKAKSDTATRTGLITDTATVNALTLLNERKAKLRIERTARIRELRRLEEEQAADDIAKRRADMPRRGPRFTIGLNADEATDDNGDPCDSSDLGDNGDNGDNGDTDDDAL